MFFPSIFALLHFICFCFFFVNLQCQHCDIWIHSFFSIKCFLLFSLKILKAFFVLQILLEKTNFSIFSIFILLLFIFIYLLVICQFLGCMCLSRNVIVYVYVKVLVYIYKYVKCQGLFHLNGHHNVTVMLTKKHSQGHK